MLFAGAYPAVRCTRFRAVSLRCAAGTRATSRRTLACPGLPEGRVAGVAQIESV